MTNDFIERLVDTINSIEGLGIVAKADYLTEKESLGVYALPGGSTIQEFMDGEKEVQLNYEIAIKTKKQQLAHNSMWLIGNKLGEFGLSIDSENGSYEFESVTAEAPSLNDRDDQGWYIYLLDIKANIITK